MSLARVYYTMCTTYDSSLQRFVFFVAGVLEMSAATESGIRLSGHTLDKATKAKVTLENYYSNLIAQHIERKQRCVYVNYLFYINMLLTRQQNLGLKKFNTPWFN